MFWDSIRLGLSDEFLTTAWFNQLASVVPSIFNRLRYLLFGGEAVEPRWVAEILKEGGPQRLLHVYGPTENTTFSSWYSVKKVPEKAITIPIGGPISNTLLFVLDKYLQPVPIGVPGELHIGGVGLARGYLNRSELTAEKFINNPFSDELMLRILIPKRHTTRSVEEGIPKWNLGTIKLPDYMIPSAFVTLENLPLTPNSKKDRRALSQLSVSNYQLSEKTFVAPRTPDEELLTNIWAEVLGVERVGVHDNFFELGGHSLLSTES